jgi:DNA-binding transcriptional LysR family regulator
MDLRQLRYAVEVGRLRHFTRAAEALGVAQPALSQSIAGLERELNVTLFDRTSRRVAPTTAGSAFIDSAARILSDVDALRNAMHEHAGLLRGRVRIGTLQLFGETVLPPVIAAFHRLHPGVDIALQLAVTADMLAALRAGELDVAIVNVDDYSVHPDLRFTPLLRDELAIAVPPGHRLADRKRVKMHELRDEAFVSFGQGSGLYATLLLAAREAGFAPHVVCESADTITIRSLVSEGIGIALLTRAYLDTPGPPVVGLELLPRLDRAIALVTRSTTAANPAARALTAFMREALPSR